MKKKFTAKDILIPTVSLFVICLVVTALLAVTNMLTAPQIQKLSKETEDKTKAEVLASADEFSDALTVSADGKDYTYYEGTASGDTIGYVFKTSAKGYGGDIDLMVGIDTSGKVTGVSILSISETAGLGMNAKNESFINQYIGKSGTIGVSKNGASDTEIQALTVATITSKAVTSAVNKALSLSSQIGGGMSLLHILRCRRATECGTGGGGAD